MTSYLVGIMDATLVAIALIIVVLVVLKLKKFSLARKAMFDKFERRLDALWSSVEYVRTKLNDIDVSVGKEVKARQDGDLTIWDAIGKLIVPEDMNDDSSE
jgi:hypothetical protein